LAVGGAGNHNKRRATSWSRRLPLLKRCVTVMNVSNVHRLETMAAARAVDAGKALLSEGESGNEGEAKLRLGRSFPTRQELHLFT